MTQDKTSPALGPLYDRDRLLAWMAERGVAQTTHDHPAVFRVEEGLELKAAMPGAHTKNLFLKDKKGRLWLISARQDTVVDLKRAHRWIGADRLSFGNETLLWETLGVRPGSVTALGLINDVDRRVTFVLDQALWDADIVNFHPLTNTATTALTQADFRQFLNLVGREPIVIDLSGGSIAARLVLEAAPLPTPPDLDAAMPAAPDFPPAPDRVAPQRALISLSDKTGLEAAARALLEAGVELVSTGGTRAAIAELGLPVKDVADLTGFPEMMDGRVKTLHPVVHGGLLGVRDAPSHAQAMAEHGIGGIDIAWIDLYPFEATVASGGGFEAAVENIDIGGPAMIRSAAKNHGYVAVCVDKAGVDEVLAALKADGATTLALRQRLAARAFARTAAYDAAVSGWFAGQVEDAAPARKSISGSLAQTLRYGENPHQTGAFYRTAEARPGVANARQLQGKELGYNNIADADAAYELVAEFDAPACVIVKHANPCGVAVGADLSQAYARALECDAVSAFGGVVAVNRPLTGADARLITDIFTEVVIAPGADDEARALFAAKKNLRLLLTDGLPDPLAAGEVFRSVAGGFLVQGRDRSRIAASDLKIVTRRQPTPQEIEDMLFAFTVAKHVKSNAIVYARDGQTAGIGAGQMNRRDSARIAAIRAREAGEAKGLAHSLAQGSACASEAFFPFADGLLEAVAAGATAVIQPGGSIRDDEVIAAADERDVAMAFTGVRVFRH